MTPEKFYEPRGVLAVGDVDDEDDLRLAQIALDPGPLLFVERRAEVVRRHAQVNSLAPRDLSLRLPQRAEKA